MEDFVVKKNWMTVCNQMQVDSGIAVNLWNTIETSYSKKGRYYHNLNHINRMMISLMNFENKIIDYQNVLFATVYHDIVYSGKRKDNEEKSAKVAENQLKKMGIDNEKIEKCCSYILATKTHQGYASDSDLLFFLDFDLEILGSGWEKYLNYTNQIRKEYHFYPDIVYKPGRKKVLQHFLMQQRIFKTNEFFEKYENQAHFNIAKELELL